MEGKNMRRTTHTLTNDPVMLKIIVFFAEANWRMLQNELNGKNCKTALGATPPNPCKIGHFITLKGNVINYPILAFFSKSGLQYSPFYWSFRNFTFFALRKMGNVD